VGRGEAEGREEGAAGERFLRVIWRLVPGYVARVPACREIDGCLTPPFCISHRGRLVAEKQARLEPQPILRMLVAVRASVAAAAAAG